MKLYVISGLGVDKRVFEKINFGNIEVQYLDWFAPLENESISDYAQRMTINIIDKNPIIIGLSFGGMIAVEIAKLIQTEKVILIASAKTKHELPKIYLGFGALNLPKLLPSSILKFHHPIIDWFFGIKSKEDSILLKNILKDTDPYFLKWAIGEISKWENILIPKNITHIHGDKDKIIPIKNVDAHFIINTGGHFMTVNCSEEISEIIQKICTSQS